MNYRTVNYQIICNRCNHVQDPNRKHCSACGQSFVFGKPDAWTSVPIQDNKKYQDFIETRKKTKLTVEDQFRREYQLVFQPENKEKEND